MPTKHLCVYSAKNMPSWLKVTLVNVRLTGDNLTALYWETREKNDANQLISGVIGQQQ